MYNILVIDDNPDDVFVIKRYLKNDESGFEITNIDNASGAIEYLKKNDMDCILLDYQLPDMSGLEFIIEYKTIHSDKVPIIFLTGQGSEQIAVQAMKNGASDYLTKNILNRDLLVKTIKYVCEKKRLENLKYEIEKELFESKEKYRSLVENISDWVWSVNAFGVYTYVSRRVYDILGYEPEEILGKTPFDLMPDDEAKRISDVFKKISEKRESVISLENINLHKDGHLVILETKAEPIISSDGTFMGYRGVDRDITDRKRSEQKLRELSLIDELTGLNNRRGFLTLAAQQIKIADRLKQNVVIIYADMDNMKVINDTYGHKTGDEALKAIALIFKRSLRNSDVIARIGGDEFVGLAIESSDYSGEKILERLKGSLESFNNEKNNAYDLLISFGMTIHKSDKPASLEDLLETADKEMYRNKQKKINKS